MDDIPGLLLGAFAGAVIAAIIGIPISIWLIRKSLKEEYHSGKYIGKGLLVARELSVSKLVTVASNSNQVEKQLQILWAGEPIDTPNIYSVVIEVANKGGLPIRSDDYESDIEIIIDAEKVFTVGQSDESGLPLRVSFDDTNKIIVDKLLLNSEDGFKLTILANNYKGFSIDGRIAGVDIRVDPESFTESTYNSLLLARLFGVLMMLMAVIVPIVIYLEPPKSTDFKFVIFLGVFYFFAGLIAAFSPKTLVRGANKMVKIYFPFLLDKE